MDVQAQVREPELNDTERKEIFSRTLYSLMQRQGWSAAELSRRANTNRDNISRYLRAVSLPDDKRLMALANAFNVDPDELLPGSALVSTTGRLRAMTNESYRIEAGTVPGLVWVRVNKQVHPSVAARIMEILAEEPSANASNRG